MRAERDKTGQEGRPTPRVDPLPGEEQEQAEEETKESSSVTDEDGESLPERETSG